MHEEDVKEAEVCEITASGDDWEAAIDKIFADTEDVLGPEFNANDIAFHDDQMRAHVADLTGILDGDILSNAFEEHRRDSQFAMGAGCTLVGDIQSCDAADDDLFLPLHLIEPTETDIILDMSATHAPRPKGVTADHTKIWRISEKDAKQTLEVTTQLSKQDADSTLSRNFGTNDRALRYRRVNSMFFMDTFLVTAKAKSARGYTMMQLFVSDKGFMKVYGMTSTSQIPQALRLFCLFLPFVLGRSVAIIAFFLQLYGSCMKKKRRPGMGTMIGRNSSLGLTRSLAIKDDPDLYA